MPYRPYRQGGGSPYCTDKRQKLWLSTAQTMPHSRAQVSAEVTCHSTQMYLALLSLCCFSSQSHQHLWGQGKPRFGGQLVSRDPIIARMCWPQVVYCQLLIGAFASWNSIQLHLKVMLSITTLLFQSYSSLKMFLGVTEKTVWVEHPGHSEMLLLGCLEKHSVPDYSCGSVHFLRCWRLIPTDIIS